ncbi:MAG: tRNA 2-thiouridine(34) synthase MnmA [Acidimicrobiales bacterium]
MSAPSGPVSGEGTATPGRVMVAMSGGVDSAVAALLCQRAGHEVVGVTLKLWGGQSDRGCCSVADVDDARRVADRLGIEHHVFNFAEQFSASVVEPYIDAHRQGITPNPCIECNRHLKFDALTRRARTLGFDLVATGHHARIIRRDHHWRLARGADAAKDQSYVLYMLDQPTLAGTLFPVGTMAKSEVRRLAAEAGLRSANKPDSQDVCFIAGEPGQARRTFLADRLALRPAVVVDQAGVTVGATAGVQLVTIGQRRGLGLGGGAAPRYVLDVDHRRDTVTVGPREALLESTVHLDGFAPADAELPPSPTGRVLVQCSAHGPARPATIEGRTLIWEEPQIRVAPGQSVVFYDPAAPDEVLGGALVAPSR